MAQTFHSISLSKLTLLWFSLYLAHSNAWPFGWLLPESKVLWIRFNICSWRVIHSKIPRSWPSSPFLNPHNVTAPWIFRHVLPWIYALASTHGIPFSCCHSIRMLGTCLVISSRTSSNQSFFHRFLWPLPNDPTRSRPYHSN